MNLRMIPSALIFIGLVNPVFASSVDDTSTQDLQHLLSDIRQELDKRGVSSETKEQRLEQAESRIKKLVNRGSWRNAVIGAVVAGAVTAHPAGLLLGGVAGSMSGKSKRYENAEEKFAEVEQEIIVDEDDFLTEGEVRLASFSGESDEIPLDQVDEYVAKKYGLIGEEGDSGEMIADGEAGNVEPMQNDLLPQFETSGDVLAQDSGYQKVTVANAQGVDAQQMQQAQKSAPVRNQSFELESCYGRSAGDRKSRENLPHCFYMMY